MASKKLRTLILDDNAHMRGLMRAILTSFDFRLIEEAGDAYSALEIVKNESIDLAFVDYRLSGLDGLEFCRLIRNAEDSPDRFLPIIMITAYSERSRVRDAVNAGADEFLVKPVRASDVAMRINAVVHNRRPFVKTDNFFGPDRRRKKDPRFKGPFRRSDDPGEFELD